MNESAIRLEEQIISLLPSRETQLSQGWVLKQMDGQLLICPLYYGLSGENILNNIQMCEEISRQRKTDCVFRLVEHTNYYLSSILTNRGYRLKTCGIVCQWIITEKTSDLSAKRKQGSMSIQKNGAGEESAQYVMPKADTVLGIREQRLFFLPDGNRSGAVLEDILQFSLENGITQILADIPDKNEMPKDYRDMGFQRAYLYRCYQKEDMKNGFTE